LTKQKTNKKLKIYVLRYDKKLLILQAVSTGLFYGDHAYFKSGWNIMDGTLVIVSLIDTRFELS